jgi:serine acetyltransferase
MVGVQATILQGINVGHDAVIGAQAFVNTDV